MYAKCYSNYDYIESVYERLYRCRSKRTSMS